MEERQVISTVCFSVSLSFDVSEILYLLITFLMSSQSFEVSSITFSYRFQ